MTTANPTGYFGNGEVEDYKVIVNFDPLDVRIVEFTARKIADEKVSIKWKVSDEVTGTKYELQRSKDDQTWTTIYIKTALAAATAIDYQFIDVYATKPVSYYRIKYVDPVGKTHFTPVTKIQFSLLNAVSIYPNPAKNDARIEIDSKGQGTSEIFIRDVSGKIIHSQTITIVKGLNSFPLNFINNMVSGIYTIQLSLPGQQYTQKLVIKK
jgi:hypothetical protein